MNIFDLPDEILLIILQKLDMIDVFYSCIKVNQRFNRLILDSFFLRDLNMTTINDINSLYDQTSSIDSKVLSRICEKILPRIYDQTYKLTVDEYSTKYMFLASNYSKLYSLSLINFQKEILDQYLTDNLILRDLLTNQITHLNIDIKNTNDVGFNTSPEIFPKILSLCKNLIDLNFCGMFPERNFVVYLKDLSWNHCIPSTLVKLTIKLAALTDCLHLLDGPFVCLSTLIIAVKYSFHTTEYKNSTKKLPKLKYFSLTALSFVNHYDDLIVPLLRRLINLEELKLYLLVNRSYSSYIDGIQLYDQFLIYMTQLKNFAFNITSEIHDKDIKIELQSNEEIQHSFIGRGYSQVVSYINSNPFALDGVCYIYSLPYDFEYFKIDNTFQGGTFYKVRKLTMVERTPFEDRLFQIISQDFPFLEILHVSNSWSKEVNQPWLTLITFPHLKFLNVKYAHGNYTLRFLLKRYMNLPRLSNLVIDYSMLMLITKNFTYDPTYFNFDKLKCLDMGQLFVRPKNFHLYFPLL
ncbi:unnamed protein product [Adineta steineri]|uniref:F-box domain-containing protein n=1 Tax=Adineta steineri TaxID=433720 RepID=A0A818T5E9_9BILA|nr:unnamed protein product [Adineta steineri]CAF3679028.1 unnamed protein product [Adineta steineri]